MSHGEGRYGRNKEKCKRYKDHQRRELNKLKRIKRSNGLDFARLWARTYHVETLLERMLPKAS